MVSFIIAVITELITGIKDCFLGVNALYKIYNERKVERHDKHQVRMTALARRRAERKKGQVDDTCNKNILRKIAKNSLINGLLFLMTILFFDYVFWPLVEALIIHLIFGGTRSPRWEYASGIFSWVFQSIWIIPAFLLIKLINYFTFQDIADAVYKKSHGHPMLPAGVGKIMADVFFSVVLQSFFLAQGMLFNLLPVTSSVAYVLSLLHISWLYSLYAFEYKWFNMGWEIHRRLHYIEQNWPYFMGFGLPMAVLTSLNKSSYINGGIFSLLFPLFIIGANDADVQQSRVNFKLKPFFAVIYITNKLFHVTLRKSSRKSGQTNVSGQGSNPQGGTPKCVGLEHS